MDYQCDVCNMEVTGLCCGKCKQELIDDYIEKDGKKIKVSKCPACEGMIKSPQCCGHDMSTASHH